MTLVGIVYLVNLLTSVDEFMFWVALLLSGLALIGSWLLGLVTMPNNKEEWREWREKCYKYCVWPKTLVATLLLTWLIPNEKVIQYMAGAYIIETTYNSEFVQKASTLAGQAVLNQLSVWAKDNGELEHLLTQLEAQGVVIPDVMLESNKSTK